MTGLRIAFCAGLLAFAVVVADAVAQSVRIGVEDQGVMTGAGLRVFFDPLVRGQLETRKIAGAVVIVVKDGAVLFSEGFGRADMASGRPMSADTPVRIASITKTLTALAVMQLVEAGRLDLDRDVNEYLDFAIPVSQDRAAVTLRRLLAHRTGFESRVGGIGASSGERLPLGPFLARHMPPRLRQNDDEVAYSNYSPALAAYIVERASGERFEQYLKAHVFDPLRMSRATALQPPPDGFEVSSGYVRSDMPSTPVSMATATIFEVGSTGVIASAADMGRLLQALLDANPRIVSRASLDLMMTRQSSVPRGLMGLGVYSPLGLGANAFVGHDGDTGGFHSTLALLPQERFGLFASYNSDGLPQTVPAAAELLQRTAERYFAEARPLSATSSDIDVAGTYGPTRRVESNLFKLRGLFEQVAVQRVDGRLTVRPAFLPFGEPVDAIEPGLFRWAGRDLSFAASAGSVAMQLGSPPLQLRRVRWWESASVNVPAVVVCVASAAVTVLLWPFALLRARHTKMDTLTRRLQAATRLALLLNVLAISAALWLVLWGVPLVALSSPVVVPVVLGTYAAAWTAVALTPIAIWHVIRFMRRGAGFWTAGREGVLALVLAVMTWFCLYWRVAGTSIAL